MLPPLPWTAGSTAVPKIAAHPVAVPVFPAHGFELLPLFGSEGLADGKEHPCVGLLEIGAGLSNLVDLREDLGFVGLIGGDHRLQEDLLLFQVGIEIDEIEAVLLKDVIHRMFLLVGQAELLRELGVIPPTAEVAVVKGALHGGRAEMAGARRRSRGILGGRESSGKEAEKGGEQKAIRA